MNVAAGNMTRLGARITARVGGPRSTSAHFAPNRLARHGGRVMESDVLTGIHNELVKQNEALGKLIDLQAITTLRDTTLNIQFPMQENI